MTQLSRAFSARAAGLFVRHHAFLSPVTCLHLCPRDIHDAWSPCVCNTSRVNCICRPILLNNAPDNTYSWTLFIILPWMSCFLNLWAFCEVVKAEQVRLLCCSGITSGLWFDVSDVPHVTQINTCCRELKDTKQMNQFTVTEVTFSTRVKQDSQMHSLFYLVLWLIATV